MRSSLLICLLLVNSMLCAQRRPKAVQIFTVTEAVSMFLTAGEPSVDKNGTIWFGSDDKLISFDGFHYTSYLLPENLVPYTHHSKIAFHYQDKLGTYWSFLSNNGLYTFDVGTQKFTPFPFSKEVRLALDKKRPIKGTVRIAGKFLLEDTKNRIWVALCGYGILCIDEKSKKQTYYAINDDTQVNDFISASWVNKGIEMPDGSLYFASNNGIVTIDSSNKIQIHYDNLPLNHKEIRCVGTGLIKGNKPNEVVMSTWGKGVKIFNTQTKQFKTFLMQKDSISGYVNIVNDLVTLTDSSFFMIKRDDFEKSGFGIFNYKRKAYSFFKQLEPRHVTREYLKIIRHGNFFWVANVNQLYRFYIPALSQQQQLTRNTLIPAGIIQPLKLNIVKLWVNDGQRSIPDSTISLANDEGNLRLLFACQGATMLDSLLFAYRLSGYEQKWHTGYGTAIQYNNLSHGKYTLEIKVVKSPFTTIPQQLHFLITVAPKWWQTWWFKLCAATIILAIAIALYRWRIKNIKNKAEMKTRYEKKIAEVEMKALRAQMNPHFIFNCLNSINRYIVKNDQVNASNYLTKFSKLIRYILDNSATGIIPLQTEIETLGLYLQMEAMRFHGTFNYTITVSDNIDTSAIFIPSMLVQPYVENAIWHGLLHKTDQDRQLSLRFEKKDNVFLQVTIEDNGIGRKMSGELKSKQVVKNNSKGIQITNDRLHLIKNLYEITASAEIIDLYTADKIAAGTRVMIILPLFQNKISSI